MTQGHRDPRRTTPALTVKPNDNLPNEPPWGMMMRPAMTPAKQTMPTMTSQTKPKRFVIWTQHLRPHRTNMGERQPTRQMNPMNSNKSKPQHKPQTNPTPAEAGVVIFKEQQGLLLLPGILLNPHPPTEAMTPPNENMRPWVRGAPTVKQYHMPAQAGLKPCGAYV
ncbi:hypothetical protein BS47DRAFT_1367124 [Hydnum rufescens UP504]|uniref:Uncharacterized protein n=1 Tax=Hydnum rufescens UP504 TaxID=1448309 RepID=A0A9P6DMC8_9AGAM|nr:hypothetical protein BS47DRAFT_1367124 [Hydnum rufescens UP504]